MDQQEFAELDFHAMRYAFESQNELGRLCDEVIYQNDFAARLEAADLGPVRKEVPVTIQYQDFAKTYSLHLLLGDAAVYELKAEARLAANHDAQLLNYLLLLDARHGKLVNFRPPKVESRFVNTHLTTKARHQLDVNTKRWREIDHGSVLLRTIFLGLLEDWGGFLELALYSEALVHFLGGEEKVRQMVALTRGGVALGNQRFQLAEPGTAFRLTALTEETEGYECQLRSLLNHSPLGAIQWINMARHKIEFVTLLKQDS
jgi:GxxExxY protein